MDPRSAGGGPNSILRTGVDRPTLKRLSRRQAAVWIFSERVGFPDLFTATALLSVGSSFLAMMMIAKEMIITTMAKTDRHASENNDNDDVDDGMSTMESSPTVALVW